MNPSRADTKTHHDPQRRVEGRDQIRSGNARGLAVVGGVDDRRGTIVTTSSAGRRWRRDSRARCVWTVPDAVTAVLTIADASGSGAG
jgi:hypothetical protein